MAHGTHAYVDENVAHLNVRISVLTYISDVLPAYCKRTGTFAGGYNKIEFNLNWMQFFHSREACFPFSSHCTFNHSCLFAVFVVQQNYENIVFFEQTHDRKSQYRITLGSSNC